MEKLKHFSLTVFTILISFSCIAQMQINWSTNVSLGVNDIGNAMERTSDGGYIIAGSSSPSESSLWNTDFLVVKVNTNGDMEWSNSYGGTSNDDAQGIREMPDGGYLVFGFTNSEDGDLATDTLGGEDCWLLKIDPTGAVEWSKTIGGSSNDCGFDIHISDEGEISLLSFTYSSDGDVSSTNNSMQVWLTKVNQNGDVIWDRTYGGEGDDQPHSMERTEDGGYILCGISEVPAGYWVKKIAANGDEEWTNYLVIDEMPTYINSAIQTEDGGYLVTGSHGLPFGSSPLGHLVGRLVKLNPAGEVEWAKSYGGEFTDKLEYSTITSEGNYLAVGKAGSRNGDLPESLGGGIQAWILMVDAQGNKLFSDAIGGTNWDEVKYITESEPGIYTMLINSESDDGIFNIDRGFNNIWMVNFNASPVSNVEILPSTLVQLGPNPTSDYINIQAKDKIIESVELYSISGQLLLTKKLSAEQGQIDVQNIQSGNYLVNVYFEDGMVSKKILVER